MSSAIAAEALFVSNLQPSDRPTPTEVRAAIDTSLRHLHGAAGCAAACAAEFGDHPDTATARMRWALSVVAGRNPAAQAA